MVGVDVAHDGLSGNCVGRESMVGEGMARDGAARDKAPRDEASGHGVAGEGVADNGDPNKGDPNKGVSGKGISGGGVARGLSVMTTPSFHAARHGRAGTGHAPRATSAPTGTRAARPKDSPPLSGAGRNPAGTAALGHAATDTRPP